MPLPNPTGKIERITELTEHGLTAKLDNGVTVAFSFNQKSINIHFSGVKTGLEIEEANWVGKPVKLANYLNVIYQPRDGK